MVNRKTLGMGIVLAALAAGQATQPTGRLVLKEGAPAPVVQWFNVTLPKLKAEEIAAHEKEAAASRRTIEEHSKSEFGSAEPARIKKVRLQTLQLGREGLEKEEKAIAALRADQTYQKVPPLRMNLGEYGDLKGRPLRVVQVIDGSNFLASADGVVVWMKGFSTGAVADRQEVAVNATAAVTGTTAYQTALGAKSTVLVVEPMDHRPWVVVEDPSNPARTPPAR